MGQRGHLYKIEEFSTYIFTSRMADFIVILQMLMAVCKELCEIGFENQVALASTSKQIFDLISPLVSLQHFCPLSSLFSSSLSLIEHIYQRTILLGVPVFFRLKRMGHNNSNELTRSTSSVSLQR
jgi:hypothetical protein